MSARLVGTPCRTTDRTGSQAIPSLWHVTPPVTSEPFLEVSGSSPISRLSPRLTLTLNQGPFPPPALPGFRGTTDLSVTPHGPACPSGTSGWKSHASTAGASRVALNLPVHACRRHYPGGTA